MIRSKNQARGFANTVAMFAVALIGVTLAGLAAQLSRDARRTTDELDRAQLRQLVIAGQLHANHLPVMLSREGYSMSVQPQSDGQKIIPFVRATIGIKSEQIK